MRAAAILLSLFLSLPIIGLLLPLFWGGGQPLSSAELGEIGDSTLLHLWNYVLTDYVVTTLLLGLGVGIGVFILGVGNAWLVANYQFPGKKLFEWGLILPLAVPAYVMAYLFVDFLQFSGPLQTILRDSFRIHAALPDPRSLGGAIWTFSLCLYPYVYLVARTSFLDRNDKTSDLHGYCFGAHGGLSGLWGGLLFWFTDLCNRDLQGLAFLWGPNGGCAPIADVVDLCLAGVLLGTA